MRLALNPREILASLAGGVLAALLVVLVFAQVGQVSPASSPVRTPLVNCISARMRSRQGGTVSLSAQVRRAERKCANQNAAGGARATPLG